MVSYVVTAWDTKTNEKYRQNAKTKKDAIKAAKKFESKGLENILIMKYSKYSLPRHWLQRCIHLPSP